MSAIARARFSGLTDALAAAGPAAQRGEWLQALIDTGVMDEGLVTLQRKAADAAGAGVMDKASPWLVVTLVTAGLALAVAGATWARDRNGRR